MTELLRCPNPECGAECTIDVYSESHDGVPSLFRAECDGPCGYSGPHVLTRDGAALRHNAMPREELWIPVTEQLPNLGTRCELIHSNPTEPILVLEIAESEFRCV